MTDRGFEGGAGEGDRRLGLARALPVIASGMVTSRSGWVETAYLPCPAGLRNSPAPSPRFTTEGGRRIALITGLSFRHADGAPDVMRGEETQIAGLGLSGTRLAVMPAPIPNGCGWRTGGSPPSGRR